MLDLSFVWHLKEAKDGREMPRIRRLGGHHMRRRVPLVSPLECAVPDIS
jgi:hypothetical protein